jgi:hypothetical protein
MRLTACCNNPAGYSALTPAVPHCSKLINQHRKADKRNKGPFSKEGSPSTVSLPLRIGGLCTLYLAIFRYGDYSIICFQGMSRMAGRVSAFQRRSAFVF